MPNSVGGCPAADSAIEFACIRYRRSGIINRELNSAIAG